MEYIITSDPNYDYIELNRTFHELSKLDGEYEESDISQSLGLGKPLEWINIIKEYRVIILSEAGSGKTAEIRNTAYKLRQQGEAAFFLHLENIPGNFEDAFEIGTYELFQQWISSSKEGWLFLDSVDEARLRNPGDFELAIRRLSRRISTAQARTHIVITGRTTAWRPKTDLAYCTTLLPFAADSKSQCEVRREGDRLTSSLKSETETQDKPKTAFKIVALDDLTRDQITRYVEARGISNSKAFTHAVERADAWTFASRPQDLQELTEFWLDRGRIGTRLEIMRNSIERRLSERDQDRADARPLSAERARKGARLLAAATTLTRTATIKIPDGAESSKGIAVRSVLPDWDDKDQSALLSRPIFDEAIYGTVRFHHRSVREYLTAEWFAELLKNETSRRAIETQFFRNQYGIEIVVPTLRPILPWLAIMDENIREKIRKVAPEIIFEGGDPSQLPLDVRRFILQEVCEQMAEGPIGYSVQDYAAVQRFANTDLTDDIRALMKKYAENEDMVGFLLRMVWLGQISDALPEAMKTALNPSTDKYTRISAFRAIKVIGSDVDQDHVRQNFLAEASNLNRKLLAELIEGIQGTEQNLIWLVSCMEKSEPNEPYSVDYLENAISKLVCRIEIKLLPQVITALNKLLCVPPMIENRYCKVSEKFQWLIPPACKAVERLISSRHNASLDIDVLAILHKFSVMRGYLSNELKEVKTEFSILIPAWKELNRALFWFEIEKTRESVDKERGERLTEFWRASLYSHFWRFVKDDFDYVAEEISCKELLDDKLVALSLAFNLYKEAKRPSAWRLKLKKQVTGDNVLSESLDNYLHPPPLSRDMRRWKRQESEWKRHAELERKKRKDYHTEWKNYLNKNLDEIRQTLRKKPGTIPNALIYLLEQARDNRISTSRWTEYNWRNLIPEYGEKVAGLYRDSTVSFWRSLSPKLRSEGASFNKTSYGIIFGLTGLEIEAIETENWPKNLSASEVELACRYASFELTGFPPWFSKLFETHPEIVSDFLLKEIRYDLSRKKSEKNTHYVISDLSWSGQWAWDSLAPHIYDLLKTNEPKHLADMDSLLKIIQGSTLSNERIEDLASLKCTSLRLLDHVARWFAVWTGVAPESSIGIFMDRILKISTRKTRTIFAMTFITNLLGGRHVNGAPVREAFIKPKHLKSLYLIMHEYIRRKEDIDRAGKGVYSPGLRDHAQDARNKLFELLKQIPGKDSFLAMMDIAKMHPEEASRPWVLIHAKAKAEQDGDMKPWLPPQVREFHDKLERTPSNHRELAEFAVLRFLDLKDDLENGDSSIASILKTVKEETDMRKYIGGKLRETAHGRYSIPQEEELADGKKPDLRFLGVGFDGPVPVELKLADNWTGPDLLDRLENQLCGDYLRDNRSNRGIFLLMYRGDRVGWDVPYEDNRVDYAKLISSLQNHWKRISSKYSNVDDITVIGIDLTRRKNKQNCI